MKFMTVLALAASVASIIWPDGLSDGTAFASGAFLGWSVAGKADSRGASETNWIGKRAPELAEGEWLNSEPLSLRQLRGKVVLLEFWTFGCSNCLSTLPHIKAWHQKFAGEQFEIIGVHTPEFEREKDLRNVKRAITRLGITYPVVTDNDYTTWTRYNQRYWPVVYLIDKRGIIRYVHIGEGAYDQTERAIASLIAESGYER